MKNIYVLFILVLGLVPAKGELQPKPTVYPGAVEMYPENDQFFLTRDSYSRVRAYYVNESNEPRTERDDGEGGKGAFFMYVRRLPDDGGVSVNERQGRSNVPNRIFSDLRGMAASGIIDVEVVDKIENEYSYLKKCYFRHEEDHTGKLASIDELIYRRYRNELGLGSDGPVDMGEVMKKAQELISSGRMQEGMDLIQEANNRQLKGLEIATSAKAVDHWMKCLEEIATNAYTTLISIQM